MLGSRTWNAAFHELTLRFLKLHCLLDLSGAKKSKKGSNLFQRFVAVTGFYKLHQIEIHEKNIIREILISSLTVFSKLNYLNFTSFTSPQLEKQRNRYIWEITKKAVLKIQIDRNNIMPGTVPFRDKLYTSLRYLIYSYARRRAIETHRSRNNNRRAYLATCSSILQTARVLCYDRRGS